MNNPDLTFDTFIEADCNRFALAGSKAIANDPHSYMPFWIYGRADYGKSHLLNSIYKELVKNIKISTLFLRADEATVKLIDCIHGDKSDWLCIENCDVLIVDNVEFLCGKPSLLKEFTELFLRKTEKGQSVIFASDCAPCHLEYLWQELNKKAPRALVADIPPEATELKILYAKNYMSKYPFDIDADALEYVIKKSSCITQLKGVLTSLGFYSANFNKKIDLDLILKRGN